MTVASLQKATTVVPWTRPMAASIPESSSLGEQLQAALVEERGQPVDRVARVLVAGEAWSA